MSTSNASAPPTLLDYPELLSGLREIFEQRIPFNQVLGLRMLSLDPRSPRMGFSMRPEMVGNFTRGMLHGGVISSVLDVAGGLAAMLSILERHLPQDEPLDVQLGRFSRVGTIDLRVDYLRPGIGESFETKSEVMRSGSRVTVVRSDLHNNNQQLIASAVAAYSVG